MKILDSLSDWNNLLKSNQDYILIKHSNSCPISTVSYQKVMHADKSNNLKAPLYVIIIQKSRDISNAITKDLNVKHESPQVIAVKNGKVSYTGSHFGISIQKINKSFE